MFSVDGTNISMSRGDTGTIMITADVKLWDGSAYTFKEEDRAVFSIKDSRGNLVKEKYAKMTYVQPQVRPAPRTGGTTPIMVSVDWDDFWEAVDDTYGRLTFTYSSLGWDESPVSYGLTVTGTAVSGDVIVVDYGKANKFPVVFYNHDTDELPAGTYTWDVRYVLHPYYDDNGRIVDGNQVITPNPPMNMNLLTVVGEI